MPGPSYKYSDKLFACGPCKRVEYLLRMGKNLTNQQLKRAKLIIKGNYTYKDKYTGKGWRSRSIKRQLNSA